MGPCLRWIALALTASALASSVAGWQGAAGPNYYVGDISLTKVSLQDSLAVCNDGSPGAFYFNPGTDSNLWIVYLEGGACYTQ
jgi:Pectinacetylesterase